MRQLAIDEAISLTVGPTERLVPSGIAVSPGERYVFAARGRWRDWFKDAVPRGWSINGLARFDRLSGRPYFLLCGMVGRDDHDAFEIGKGRKWTAPAELPADRQLYLFANDWCGMCWHGRVVSDVPLTVMITRSA